MNGRLLLGKRHNLRLWLWSLLVLLVACAPTRSVLELTSTPEPVPHETLRLFWVNSYSGNDPWSLQVRDGVLETLRDAGYRLVADNFEFKVFNMNVRRVRGIDDLTPVADEAIVAIQAFNPDVVLVTGEEAALSILPRYGDSELPFVFCGLSELPAYYDDLTQSNVTGIREEAHPVQTVAMAYAFVEDASRFMVLGDGSVSGRLKAVAAYTALSESEFGASDPLLRITGFWQSWQQVVLEDAAEVDFILLTSYEGVLDGDGYLVDSHEVMAWMAENSPVPVFALTNQAVLNGAVGGLVAHGYEEGTSAAQLVVRIAEGAAPSEIPVEGPARNLLAMNLAAAYRWNLRVPVTFPVAAQIYETVPVD